MAKKIVIRNGRLVNVVTREVLSWEVAIEGKRIACIGSNLSYLVDSSTQMIDAKGQFLVPGLISAHDHYEMTLMSAVPFAEAVLPSGTTAVILDPHDIVNVMGIEGMRLMIEESLLAPLKAFFMVPPCVPPAPKLENASCEIRLEDVQEGLQFPNVLGIAEAMSFLRVLDPNDTEMQKILQWAQSNHLLIDGHCPEIRGNALCRYITPGPIRTDHESLTVEEQLEKLRLGMYVILRRGSIEEPMSAGELVNQLGDTSNLLLSVDGCISAEDVIEHGHMSWAVRQIISEGVDPLVAIQMATVNPARCYGLDNRIGLIAPGRSADILLVDDLESFHVTQVMVNGQLIKAPLGFSRFEYPAHALRTINLAPVSGDDFVVHAPIGLAQSKVQVRVIGIVDGALTTEEIIKEMAVHDGIIEADPERDLLKVAIFERYGGKTRSIGFIHGFGLKQGAIAGSIGQDSQNIVAVGVSDADLTLAVNRVREINGGVVVVNQNQQVAILPLPIAGIMTDIDPHELVAKRALVTTALRELGCQLADPIFALSLSITLVVIPYLKISNKGLVDVTSGEFVNLFI